MSETFTPDKLIAGHFPRVTTPVTILTGQTLNRGAVLGKVSASGKYILSDSGAADGSQDPKAVLAENVDAAATDVESIAYLTGEFNEAEISLGGTDTADTVREALRDRSIFLKENA